MTTPFWKAVEELARLRDQIPPERREMSGVRIALLAYPPAVASLSDAVETREPEKKPASKG